MSTGIFIATKPPPEHIETGAQIYDWEGMGAGVVGGLVFGTLVAIVRYKLHVRKQRQKLAKNIHSAGGD